MFEIYRSGNVSSSSFDRHKEICRNCAVIEVKNGYYVEYDFYLSERTDCVSMDDCCEVCGESFFRDGRKLFTKLDKVIY